MPETQPQEQTSRIIPMTVDDLILMRLEDLRDEFRESRKDLSERMNKQDAGIDELADKIDALSAKIDSAMNHGQIITVSSISIAVGVLYAVFFNKFPAEEQQQ